MTAGRCWWRVVHQPDGLSSNLMRRPKWGRRDWSTQVGRIWALCNGRRWIGLKKHLARNGKLTLRAAGEASLDAKGNQHNKELVDKPRQETVCGIQNTWVKERMCGDKMNDERKELFKTLDKTRLLEAQEEICLRSELRSTVVIQRSQLMLMLV